MIPRNWPRGRRDRTRQPDRQNRGATDRGDTAAASGGVSASASRGCAVLHAATRTVVRADGGRRGGAGTRTRPDRSPLAGDPAARAVVEPRPGKDRGTVQPEGRGREDHVDDQPGRGAGRVRPSGPAGGLRSVGR